MISKFNLHNTRNMADTQSSQTNPNYLPTEVIEPFTGNKYPLQDLNCLGVPLAIAVHPAFVRAVSERILRDDICADICANLRILQVPDANLQSEVYSMLRNLSHQITNASTKKYDTFSKTSNLSHFDSHLVSSYINFAMSSDGMSANIRIIFNSGLASWCDLFRMTITQPAN